MGRPPGGGGDRGLDGRDPRLRTAVSSQHGPQRPRLLLPRGALNARGQPGYADSPKPRAEAAPIRRAAWRQLGAVNAVPITRARRVRKPASRNGRARPANDGRQSGPLPSGRGPGLYREPTVRWARKEGLRRGYRHGGQRRHTARTPGRARRERLRPSSRQIRGRGALAPSACSVDHGAGEAIEPSAAIAGGVAGVADGKAPASTSDRGARRTPPARSQPRPAERRLVYIGDLGYRARSERALEGGLTKDAHGKSSPVVVEGGVLVGSTTRTSRPYAKIGQAGPRPRSRCHRSRRMVAWYQVPCSARSIASGREQYHVSRAHGASPAVVGHAPTTAPSSARCCRGPAAQGAVALRAHGTAVPVLPRGGRGAGGAQVVHCLEADTGKVLWTFATKGRVDSSPVIAGGRVHIGSADGRVYALDLTSGQPTLEFDAGGPITASPALAGGRLVIGTQDGQVFCPGPGLSRSPGRPVLPELPQPSKTPNPKEPPSPDGSPAPTSRRAISTRGTTSSPAVRKWDRGRFPVEGWRMATLSATPSHALDEARSWPPRTPDAGREHRHQAPAAGRDRSRSRWRSRAPIGGRTAQAPGEPWPGRLGLDLRGGRAWPRSSRPDAIRGHGARGPNPSRLEWGVPMTADGGGWRDVAGMASGPGRRNVTWSGRCGSQARG
jgi:hypothetical protein